MIYIIFPQTCSMPNKKDERDLIKLKHFNVSVFFLICSNIKKKNDDFYDIVLPHAS